VIAHSEATQAHGFVRQIHTFENMNLENTTQNSKAPGNIGTILLIFVSGLAAGAALVYMVHESKVNNPGNQVVKGDSIQEVAPSKTGTFTFEPEVVKSDSTPKMAPPTPLAVNTTPPSPAQRPPGIEKPKNLGNQQGGIDVNGFRQLAASEAVAVSYQEYLNFTNAWAQSHPNNQPSCTWGGRIHKDALSRVIGSLPEGNPWVRFKFGSSGTESRTFILFTGNLNAQGGSVIYRNGGEPGTFCPIQCD
jgi:hypothetical protein